MTTENPTRPTIALLAPTEQTLVLDGVETRLWGGVSEHGTPFRLAVHRCFMELGHEAAFVRDFPMLEERAKPKRMESHGVDVGALDKVIRAEEREACADVVRRFRANAVDAQDFVSADRFRVIEQAIRERGAPGGAA